MIYKKIDLLIKVLFFENLLLYLPKYHEEWIKDPLILYLKASPFAIHLRIFSRIPHPSKKKTPSL
jgi:hypothetical protein